MGVFTFVCRKGNGGGEWSAKQIGDEAKVDETCAADIYSLQRRLVQAAASVDSSGGIQSSFSLVTPDSAVCQVIVGGGVGVGVGGGFIASGGGAAAPASGGGAAAAEEKKEEKKEEEKEESDDDMGFSLFD